MRFAHLAAIVVMTVAASLLTYPNARAAVSPARAELVQACKAEAVLGHLRHLGTQRLAIEAHKQRMTGLCDRMQTAGVEEREALRRSCLNEAAWGALLIHRGGNHDRSHMMRQQRLCEGLAAAE